MWSTARAESREQRAESTAIISVVSVVSVVAVTYQLCISSMSLHTVLILYLYLNKTVMLSIQ